MEKTNTDPKDFMSFVAHYIFIQMNAQEISHYQMFLNEGIQMFGERAIQALMKEFAQLVDLDVFNSIMTDALTKE